VPWPTIVIGSGRIQRPFDLRPKPLPHMYARIRSASEFPGLRRSVKTPKVCSYIRGEMSPVVWVTGDRQTTSWVLGHAWGSTKDPERWPLHRRDFWTRANFLSSLPTLQVEFWTLNLTHDLPHGSIFPLVFSTHSSGAISRLNLTVDFMHRIIFPFVFAYPLFRCNFWIIFPLVLATHSSGTISRL
jgi:hypothetical protein